MNTIVSLIVATFLLQGITGAKIPRAATTPPQRYPKSDEIVHEIDKMNSTFDLSSLEKFRNMNIDDLIELLDQYFESKSAHTIAPEVPEEINKPINAVEPATTPGRSQTAIDADASERSPKDDTPASTPSTTDLQLPSNASDSKTVVDGTPVSPAKSSHPNTAKFREDVDKEIMHYKAGKTAEITANGTVKIDGTIVYKKIAQLKPNTKYNLLVRNGKLSLNNKIIFKNDPQSKFKIPWKNIQRNFANDTMKSLRITIQNDGSLKCVDSDGNVLHIQK